MRRFKFDYVVVGLVAIAALVPPFVTTICEPFPRRKRGESRQRHTCLSSKTTALHEVNKAVATLAAARQKLVTAQSVLASARQQELRIRSQYDRGDLSRLDLLGSLFEIVTAEAALSDAQLLADSTAGALEDAMQSPLGLENLVLTNPRSLSGRGRPQP